MDRQRIYLGVYGSPESREAFSWLLDRLRAGEAVKTAKAARKPRKSVFTLNDLFLRFVTEELPRYSAAEQFCLKSAIWFARELLWRDSVGGFLQFLALFSVPEIFFCRDCCFSARADSTRDLTRSDARPHHGSWKGGELVSQSIRRKMSPNNVRGIATSASCQVTERAYRYAAASSNAVDWQERFCHTIPCAGDPRNL